jgi:hypothetical protein
VVNFVTWHEEEEEEEVVNMKRSRHTNRRTDGQTNIGYILIRKNQLSLWLRWAKTQCLTRKLFTNYKKQPTSISLTSCHSKYKRFPYNCSLYIQVLPCQLYLNRSHALTTCRSTYKYFPDNLLLIDWFIVFNATFSKTFYFQLFLYYWYQLTFTLH